LAIDEVEKVIREHLNSIKVTCVDYLETSLSYRKLSNQQTWARLLLDFVTLEPRHEIVYFRDESRNRTLTPMPFSSSSSTTWFVQKSDNADSQSSMKF
jgi:hypothetical protein